MAAEVRISAEPRVRQGTAECRRLRKQGIVPGNIYGHGEGSQAIRVTEHDLLVHINAGHKIVDVDLEGGTQKTMFRELQWDTYGQRVLHFDLIRVSADERVEVEVPIVLLGTAPGAEAGGVVDQHIYAIPLEMKAVDVIDSISVKIHELEIGDSILVNQIDIPEGTKVLVADDAVVVQVNEPEEVDLPEDLEAEAETPAEPEVIGRESDEDGDDAESDSHDKS